MQFQRGTNIFAADAGRRRLSPGRRGHVCLLLAVLFACVLMTGTASAAWDGKVNTSWYQNEIAAGHNGSSENNPLRIYDARPSERDKRERLMKDLDLNGAFHNWYPIENTTTGTGDDKKFKGTFDGGSKAISNMRVRSLAPSLKNMPMPVSSAMSQVRRS